MHQLIHVNAFGAYAIRPYSQIGKMRAFIFYFIVKQNWFAKKWNGTQRHKDTELYFLREQSSQSKSLALWSLPSLYIYFSVPLCLCVQ